MSAQRIVVTGPANGVTLAAALLATRWNGPGREVVALIDQEPSDPIVLRPSHERAHGLLGLGLADFIDDLGAAPAFSYEAASADGVISIPFSGYGLARSGVEFHHFWRRGFDLGEGEALERYSLALALGDKPQRLTPNALAKLPVTYGLQVDRKAYSDRLNAIATSRGATITEQSTRAGIDASIVFNLNGRSASGSANELFVAASEAIAGLDWLLSANAVLRFLSLPEAIDPRSPEREEFDRLTSNEADRVEDMLELLSSKDPINTDRPALKRKVDVFAACGRIPTEDFEVFGQSEWLTALWARDIRPRRVDRMAEQLPDQALLEWLSSLRSQVDQITTSEGRA